MEQNGAVQVGQTGHREMQLATQPLLGEVSCTPSFLADSHPVLHVLRALHTDVSISCNPLR